MQFSIKEWRRIYDKVSTLSKTLRDSRPTYDDFDNYIAPKIAMTRHTQEILESKIKSLTQRSDSYLDQCGIKSPAPLWHYDGKNPETHASAPEFKFGHLMG